MVVVWLVVAMMVLLEFGDLSSVERCDYLQRDLK
jgi:hypothetical protein